MIHKIIGGKSKQRNIKSSINYLLRKNKLEEQQHVKILTKTNEDDLLLFNKTIKADKKRVYVCGCLSFEEKNIEESIKFDLIEDLENTLFAGISKENRPPILWVQHTDKGRLELNYLTFNQLQDGRSYTTYLHKYDKKLIESLKDFYNLKYQFSNPNDPNKKNIIPSRSTNDSDEKATTQAQINNILLTQIALNNINNREELIRYIENDLKLELTSAGKDYITIKINDKKIYGLRGRFMKQNEIIELMQQAQTTQLQQVQQIMQDLLQKQEKILTNFTEQNIKEMKTVLQKHRQKIMQTQIEQLSKKMNYQILIKIPTILTIFNTILIVMNLYLLIK